MAKIGTEDPLLPSILDRLLDDEPDSHVESARSRAQLLRDLKQCVRRDLENLLNSRWRCSIWPPDLDQLDSSLLNYGTPDFSGVNMGSAAAREELRGVLEKIIRRFEPRFKRVSVRLLDNSDGARPDRTLRFQIDGLLHAEPAPERVQYDTEVETPTGQVHVGDRRR
jgi:type VI secretion system protein ImpF